MAKVLIVDDVLIMRNILRVMLENAGHEIAGNAENGKEALVKYSELNPDLVTLDIQMKDGDGMTFLQQLTQQNPDARVIMVSAIKDDEIRKQAFDLGAAGYVTKPFQINEILEQTKKALAK